ncbi:MAG TPA: cellulase family glycosylhydrolase [Armatimonadota bacterium]|jgi:hypothetical protein
MFRAIIFVLAAVSLLDGRSDANPRSIPSQTFPDAFGVNIHFTKGAPGEVEALSQAYKVARMDFGWGSIERVRGQYDFADYDGLARELEANGVRPLFILDYGNDLYGKGPVRTPEQRKAYAAFCVAAARHFKGRKIMWEFWNEPNGTGFWGGRPDPEEYASMVNAAAPAILKADRNATLLLGAFAGFPWDYIETVFKRGCLRWADAVSVHPYRSGYPETATQDYTRLRRLIAQYSPNRDVPIISGEWGYSTNRKTGIPELRQAQYLVRQRLNNVRCGILTSIWYDWKEDGPDPDENEHHFGSTHQDFSPKPAYIAARTMTKTLAGYKFVRMLEDGPDKYVMLLRNAKGESALALWTIGPTAAYKLSRLVDRLDGVEMDGRHLESISTDGNHLGSIPYGPSPRYVLLGRSAEMDVMADWSYLPPDTVVVAGKPVRTTLTLRNTGEATRKYAIAISVAGGAARPARAFAAVAPGKTARIPVTLDLWKRAEASAVVVTVNGRRTAIPLIVANPVTVSAAPLGDMVTVDLRTPGVRTGETLSVRITDASGRPVGAARPVKVRPGTYRYATQLHIDFPALRGLGVSVTNQHGREIASMPPLRLVPVGPLAKSIPGAKPKGLAVHPEGKGEPGGSVVLRAAKAGARGIVADLKAEFPDGWRYFVVTPERTAIPDNAVALGMWVNGDGCGDNIRARYWDSKGQTYQPTFGAVSWKGWRWITMRLDDPSVGSWGGPQDGVIHRPIKWDSVFLLDSASTRAHSAHVQFGGLTLLTR